MHYIKPIYIVSSSGSHRKRNRRSGGCYFYALF
nr:MAG TPA: hypothetical protein [Caudoviricetes sp.]